MAELIKPVKGTVSLIADKHGASLSNQAIPSTHAAAHDQVMMDRIRNTVTRDVARERQKQATVKNRSKFGTETPSSRNRKAKEREIEKTNNVLFHKIQNIWREPPAPFHAPSGYKSAKIQPVTSIKPKTKRDDVWPAPNPSTAPWESQVELMRRHRAFQRLERDREIAKQNIKLREKILNPFSGRPSTGYMPYAKRMERKATLDTSQAWRERMAHYEEHALKLEAMASPRRPGTAPPTANIITSSPLGKNSSSSPLQVVDKSIGLRNTASIGPKSSDIDYYLWHEKTVRAKIAPQRDISLSDKGIPKTLTMVSCQGCAKKSYYLGDGKAMFPCSKCDEVYYCSKACEEFDYPHHRSTCRGGVNASGSWNPYGASKSGEGGASERFWVTNGAMQKARGLLRNRDEIWGEGNETRALASIKKRYQEDRRRELLRDAEMDMVNKMQLLGLSDGPRPCLTISTQPL